MRAAVERARNGNGPQAVEALSVRMHGHAAHDDARYVPAGMREEFAERYDPVGRLAARLALDGFGADAIDGMREAAAAEVAAGLAEAEQAPAPDPGDARATASTPPRRSPDRAGPHGRQEAAEHQVDQDLRASAPDPSRARDGDGGTCGRRR